MNGSKAGWPRLLWVGRDQPSRLGAGSQQRSAHLLIALADFFDIHLVVVTIGRGLPRSRDVDLFDRFASFGQIVTTEPGAGSSPDLPGSEWRAVVAAEDIPARLVAERQGRDIHATMIVTFELAVALRSVIAKLQPAYLELDELMSRRQERFLATPGLPRGRAEEFERGLRLMRLLERQILPAFRGVIVSSELEKANLRGLVPDDVLSFVPNATHREATLPPAPREKPHTIMFVGRMDYFPNLDGMQFFVREVWPLLRARFGDDVRLHIVGGGAPPSFTVDASAGVTLDRDRADVMPVYREAAIAVVPIRSGGGTRVKIIEAFTLGRAVVSTRMGAEGLGAEPGRHLLIADTPEELASACARLIEDPQLAASLAAEAAEWVRTRHSTAAVRAAVAESVIVRAFRP